MRRTDYEHAGLPEAEDYDPEALGTVSFRTGEPDQVWDQYGIEMVPIEYRSKTEDDWTDTGRRHVVRNGTFISDVSEDYKLLPNERLIEVANDVARDLGAEPFHEFDGDWFATLDDHVFQDDERRRVHGVYAWDQGTIGGDDMEYGFAVHNSIDGSLGFSVGLFTFRHACANMVFIGTSSSAEQMALNVEQEREILNKTSHKHTSSLEVEKEPLKASIKGTLTLINNVDATYEQWVEEEITPRDVADILNLPSVATRDLPGWMQDIPDAIEDARENESLDDNEPLPPERQAEVIEASMPEARNKWETYNDLTEALWHGGSSSDTTRRRKMKEVHRVFDPAEAGDDDVTLR